MAQGTKRYALVSVTDKRGVVEFCRGLQERLGMGILSTGGTAKALRDGGLEVTDVADYTASPEVMQGRVKTLHPRVHGGILHDRSNQQHVADLDLLGGSPIDVVVVNLYDFAQQARGQGLELEKAIEFIDIGGPSMLRSAAKNYKHVAVVCDPDDYEATLEEWCQSENQGQLSLASRSRLAAKVFAQTAAYDGMIAAYFQQQSGRLEDLSIPLKKHQDLRYGENPHQTAAFFTYEGAAIGLQKAEVLQGKELSYNNYLDIDAACAIVSDLSSHQAIAIIKHTNPCGVAAELDSSRTAVPLVDTYQKALGCDPKSAFGGIVASSRVIDESCASAMAELFLECIAAPDFSPEAREVFARKKNLRLLKLPEGYFESNKEGTRQLRSVRGGVLVQDLDDAVPSLDKVQSVTSKKPDPQQALDLQFAQIVCKHVKSNAIVYVREGVTLAVGAGQMSRIDSAEFASGKGKQAGVDFSGAVLASDAFFPFRDTVDFAAGLGIAAIIQPGGSKRDDESIAAADEHGIAMVFTGQRHFKH